MSKHLPTFYTNTFCLWIDEGTAGQREEGEEKGRPAKRMRMDRAGGKRGRLMKCTNMRLRVNE